MIPLSAQSIYLEGKLPIAVCIPSIPPRMYVGENGQSFLERAINSVHQQSSPPMEIHVAYDLHKEGAAATRQNALDMVVRSEIEWIAFLDDDDYWYPNHLRVLWDLVHSQQGNHILGVIAAATNLEPEPPRQVDVAYSWFDGNDPFPMHRGRQFDPADPHHLTMNIMVRRELAQAVGFTPHPDANPDWPGEDWRFILELNARGARFAGTDKITWHYSVHGSNTSGLADRW